ncbi:WW domain-containing oxidoreductase [Colletotrichum fructicola]|nr:WW domain-containing oxidoreductase [Colletotrichum fructicola]
MSKYAAAHENIQGPGDARPTAAQIIDDENLHNALVNKTIFITGANQGIGLETARALHSTGATIYLGVRDLTRGQTAIDDIKSTNADSKGSLHLVELSLDSLASVRKAAADFTARSKQLNILVLNAGVMPETKQTTEDGFEKTFATNHLGHFLLFQLLKPLLLASSTPQFHSRVVAVASMLHRGSEVLFDDYNFTKRPYDTVIAYSQTKIANVYLANEIERRYGAQGLHGLSLHPGSIITNMNRHQLGKDPAELRAIFGEQYDILAKSLKSPAQGAATTVHAAPASVTPITDQESATTDRAAATVDLWQEAYNKVDENTRKWIDSIPGAADAKDPVKELVELVRLREEKHGKGAPKLTIGGRQILWRDYASRVISLLTAIGDIAVTVAPAPSSTVWSAVKMLLKTNVLEREDLVAVMGCADIVLCLVRRGIVYEEVYIRGLPRLPAQEDLKQELVKVYSNCLEFLAFVDGELQHGNMRRFLEALLDPGHGDKRVSAIKALEQRLQFAAQACEAKASSEHRGLIQSLAWPLKRVDDNVAAVLERLADKEKEKAMTYISTVPVGVHHNEKPSRPEHDLNGYMRSFQGPQTMITISTLDNRGDIKTFVDAEVDNFAANWEVETKQLIKDVLVEKSDGMFRWTYLQWEQLKDLSTNGGVKQRLGTLPKTLTEAYDEVYDRFDPGGVECFMMQRVVRWIMCARQPLESRALLAAIRIESEEANGEQSFDKADLTEPILEAVCRHLVVRDPKLGVWKFPHASVAEYFRAKNDSWVKDAEGKLTVILTKCLIDFCSSVWPMKCLMNDETVVDLSDWLEARRAAPKHTLDPWHPLHRYITRNWLQHIHNISNEDSSILDVVQALKRFLGEASPQKSSWEYRAFCLIVISSDDWTYDNSSGNYMRASVDPYDNPVFGVVTFGLHRFLAGWWDKDVDISSLVNAEGSDLLAIAAYLGYTELCEYLIHQGCDININTKTTCHSALGASIHQQKIGTMRMLLEKGANPDRVMNHHSLLCLATEKGIDYCTLLLEKGADPNTECRSRSCFRFVSVFGVKHYLRRGLSRAAYSGNLSIMKALIDKGADVNPDNLRDLDGSPLAAAVYMGQLDCARFLIAKGAGVNAQLKYRDFGSPLTASVCSGELECARLLVEHGADVNMNPKFGPYGSPLAAAVSMGQLDCARFLVASGADVNAYLEFGEYGSVLAAAILGKHPVLDMVKFLVEEQQAGPSQLIYID